MLATLSNRKLVELMRMTIAENKMTMKRINKNDIMITNKMK